MTPADEVVAGPRPAAGAGHSLGALRHFVLQHERPAHLRDLDLTEIDPPLRALLFTDGTVTRGLEVQALARVSVRVVAQSKVAIAADVADYLGAPVGRQSVLRRVAIGAGEPPSALIWAESHMLLDRLPSEFLSVLHDAPDGIGESLQQVELESWRDMLWFGLDSPPSWSEVEQPEARPVITRLYRVVTGGQPALLIAESFAVEYREGRYRLGWDRAG